jgi:Lrp/AsnC family leucine-responsive transcriptional regulator
MSRKLDRIDQKIIAILQRDARITNQALAGIICLSPRACLDRVKKLERDGIIQQYSVYINFEELADNITVFAEVTMRDQRTGTQINFELRMRDTPEVISCHLVSGSFDYLVRLVCQDFEHYKVLTSRWLDETTLGVARVVSLPQIQTIKETYGIPIQVLYPRVTSEEIDE